MLRKKLLPALTLVLLSAALLSGCGARPLPDGIEEEAAGEAGKEIVQLLLAGNYQAVADAFDPTIRESLGVSAQLISDSISQVLDAGEYLNTYQVMAVGGQSKNYDGDFVTVGIYCEHEEVDIVYELSFDTDLELIGLDAKQKRKGLFG